MVYGATRASISLWTAHGMHCTRKTTGTAICLSAVNYIATGIANCAVSMSISKVDLIMTSTTRLFISGRCSANFNVRLRCLCCSDTVVSRLRVLILKNGITGSILAWSAAFLADSMKLEIQDACQ